MADKDRAREWYTDHQLELYSLFDAMATYAAERVRDELENAARECEFNRTGCDKPNVSCHNLDAEAIRKRLAELEAVREEQG